MPLDPLNRLCKWRTILAGWHLGTRSMNQPGTSAMRDLMDKWLVMRAENSALAALMVQKGVFTANEFTDQVHHEADLLNAALEQAFPGFCTIDEGIKIVDLAVAQKTMRDKRFPP